MAAAGFVIGLTSSFPMSDGGTPAASLVAGLATAHWVATAIALCHGALAAYIAGDLKIMCATRRLVSASIVRALSPGRRQPTLPRHALRLRRYRLRPSRRLRTEAVCLQITPVTSATLPVRLPFPPPWSAAHWSLTNPAFPAGSGVARASSLANFLAGVQQVFDDIAGWGTWIRTKAARSRAGSSTAKLSPTRNSRNTTSEPTRATHPGCVQLPPSRRREGCVQRQHL